MAAIFISYRSTDHQDATRLKAELELRGHTVWLDSEQIHVGDSIVSKINEGLTRLEYLVLCYSSSENSSWTNQEWMSTLKRQLDGVDVKVLPVRLTGGTPPAILADTRYADLVENWDQGIHDLCKSIAP